LLLRDLVELLVPAACAGCGGASDAGAPLCARCDARLPRLPRAVCALCQERSCALPSRHCRVCEARRSPLFACLAAAPWAGAVEDFVHRFKYPRPGLLGLDPGPRAVACALVREAGERAPLGAELVVPVPLHPARLRQRGFNPAALLARCLARAHGLPVAPRALERVRDTPSQTGLDRRARARNVAGAFRVRRGARIPARVWLVDDVVTTGATLREAARALRHAGARRVIAICAARTLRNA
jgi:ComF family protein